MASDYDVIIIGAGAAGLMCAATAGQGGQRVLVIDHAKSAGEKIRISGGGRCNFTNLHCGPNNFISQNSHFCKSALSRYQPSDFIAMVERYGITYHEKVQTGMQLGQLFCDDKSQQIIDMLLAECKVGDVQVKLQTDVLDISKSDAGFTVTTSRKSYSAARLVIACGGPSIPKMGASGFGYKVARDFGLAIIPTRPALVPLTLTDSEFDALKNLSGLAAPARISHDKTHFDEAMLITHRGLSGPAILQISSYWREGDPIKINLAASQDIERDLRAARQEAGRSTPKAFFERYIPAKLAAHMASQIKAERLGDLSKAQAQYIIDSLTNWMVKPAGTEGYRKAEVTLGGVDTNELSSKTMEAKAVPRLYFIGEVVDVTGHLGGHNFQWAWASGYVAGQALAGLALSGQA